MIPEPLVQSIRAGECVAFVGAGFSAAAVPGWASLLRKVAEQASRPTREEVLAVLGRSGATAFDLEACGQKLEKDLGLGGFQREVREILAHPPVDPTMQARLRHLQGIPFRAVLTTNFDGLLPGSVPGRNAYLSVLRPRGHEWWRERFWEGDRLGPQVVKLHGDIVPDPPRDLVMSRSAYRQRLYGNPGYRTFLRAVLATSTVLYLGFSFTDAYLNELRTEVLALLEHGGADEPVAYAVLNDRSPAELGYFREYEGIEVLTYDSHGGRDHSGFDELLRELYEATNPTERLGSILAGRHLLWLDAEPRNNEYGMRFLLEAAGSRECAIEAVRTWTEAVERLESGRWDLAITHWGHDGADSLDGGRCSVAERILLEIRRRDLRLPVLVFASGAHAAENRRTAMGLGAQAYAAEWGHLFREIERVVEA
jgi:hypothetical protein